MDMQKLMKQYARHVRTAAGGCIIAEGSPGDSFFYIISGRVRIVKKIGDAQEALRELGPGDFFGELALIHDKPRAASVIAMEDTELYEMSRSTFTEMLRSNTEISMEIFCTSSNWLLESDRQYIEKLQNQTRELTILLQQKDQLTRSLEHERGLVEQEKEKYRSLLENSLVGVFVEQDGKVVFANNTFAEMMDFPSSEHAAGLSLESLLVPGTRKPVREDTGRKDIEHYEVMIHTATGDERIWEVRSVPIVMNNEKAMLSNASDLTDKKRLEQENEETKMQLMQESKLASIGFLAAGIAHNLNNPISAIYTVAQLIRQEHPDMSEAERILQQCRNMMNIIDGLMVKSRMDQSHEIIAIEFNKLLENELRFYEANLDFKHDVVKEYHFEEKLPVTYGIYSDFSQAIMNIVKNAVDSMAESPEKRLNIRTYSDSICIFIEISDTGCGIPEKNLGRIFEPFFSTKSLPGKKMDGIPSGTGLGMASSLQLIRNYLGNIKVRSEVGKGTNVTIMVPITRQ